MNPDLANLLGALRDQPDDEVAYLALADWCLDQPDPPTQARGEHVRLSLELGKIPRRDVKKRRPLADWVKSLEKRHRLAWLGPMRDLAHRCDFLPGGLVKVAFSGGRIDQSRVTRVAPLSESSFAWVSSLETRAVNRDHLNWLAGLLPTACVRKFVLAASLPYPRRETQSAAALLRVLPRCRWLSGVRCLGLNFLHDSLDRSPVAAPDLADLSGLHSLQELSISGMELTADACRALAGAPHLARLRELHLDRCGLGEQHLRALLTPTFTPPLHTLSLASNNLTSAAAAILAGWPGLKNLRTLNLAWNLLGGPALDALAR